MGGFPDACETPEPEARYGPIVIGVQVHATRSWIQPCAALGALSAGQSERSQGCSGEKSGDAQSETWWK